MIYSLAVDGANPALVYVVNLGGLYRSVDGAGTWSRIGASLPSPIYAVASDPSSPSSVYVAAGSSQIFRSSDSGATWAERAPVPVLGADPIHKLIYDPSGSGKIYAVTRGSVYRSTTGVTAWVPSGAGLPYSTISDFVVVPGAPSVLYAALPEGVYRSGDGGGFWSLVSSGPILGIAARSVGTLSGSPNTVFTGLADSRLFWSLDGGSTWAYNNQICTLPTGFAVSPASPATIYAACGNVILRSVNSGSSWSATSVPNGSFVFLGIAAATTSSTTVYAVDLRGAYRSSNGGTTWYAANSGLRNTTISSVAIDPVTPDVVLVTESDNGSIFRSADAGVTWTSVWATGGLHYAVAIDPSSHLTAYGGGALGLWKTTDGGTNWVRTPLSSTVLDIRIDPSAPATVYAATVTGVYKTLDRGGVWNPSGLTTYVSRLAIDPSNTQILYAATFGQGLFQTVDGASTWNSLAFPGAIVDDVLVTTAPAGVVAAVRGSGLFRSTDGGSTWTPVGSGLASVSVNVMAKDPSSASTIYAGTKDAGVWKSTDAGVSFSPFSAGFPVTSSVLALAASPSGRFLVAGSTAAGAFRYSITSNGFYTVPPCRILDTRDPDGPFGGPSFVASVPRTVSVYGRCGIPANARAVAANVAVTRPTAAGFVTAWQGGTSMPNASTLNFRAGQTRANNATLILGAAGDVLLAAVMADGSADVIVDVTGYFAP